MAYKVTEENNITTVFLDGEIDMDVVDKVKEIIMPHIETGKIVHINLKDVQYMDSSGISILIESHQKAEEKNTKVILVPRLHTWRVGPSHQKMEGFWNLFPLRVKNSTISWNLFKRAGEARHGVRKRVGSLSPLQRRVSAFPTL